MNEIEEETLNQLTTFDKQHYPSSSDDDDEHLSHKSKLLSQHQQRLQKYAHLLQKTVDQTKGGGGELTNENAYDAGSSGGQITERDGGGGNISSSHTPNIEEQIVLATTTFNQGHDISEEFDPNKFKKKLEEVSTNFQKHMR